VYGDGIHLSTAHFYRRSGIHGDLPLKIGPFGNLRPSHDRPIQNVGTAIDNPYAAGVEVSLFMEVHGKHGIPEPECPPETIRPGPVYIDPDANTSKQRFS
jgi:hypothetical protein